MLRSVILGRRQMLARNGRFRKARIQMFAKLGIELWPGCGAAVRRCGGAATVVDRDSRRFGCRHAADECVQCTLCKARVATSGGSCAMQVVAR